MSKKEFKEKSLGLELPLILYVSASFISLFILIFQSSYYKLDAIHNVLWSSYDLPGIGITNIPKPFGEHFFGDFLHVITASTRDLGDTLYYPYLPASLIVGKFFSIFSYQFAVILYFSVFFTVYFRPLHLIWNLLNITEKFLLAIFLSFNIGTLYLFDRGNIQLVVSAFIAVFIFYIAKKRYNLAALALGVAVSIKLWPLFFVFPLIRLKKYRAFALLCIMAIVLNVLPLLIFKSNSLGTFGYIKSQFAQIVSFGSLQSGLWHAGGKNSSFAALLYFLDNFTAFHQPFRFILQHFVILQMLGLIGVAFVLLRNRLLLGEQFLTISLFLLLFPSAQYGYSMSILIPTLIYCIYEKYHLRNNNLKDTLDYIFYWTMFAMIPISYVLPVQQTEQWFVDLNTLFTPIMLGISFIGLIQKTAAYKPKRLGHK